MGTICTKVRRKDHRVEAAGPSTDGEDEIDSSQAQEYSLCNAADLPESQMKLYKANSQELLLVKERDEVFAFGTKCTHYGAPLEKGFFCKGKVYCPWHGACFDTKTGDIEEFPALDPIASYPVRVEVATGEVKVSLSVGSGERPAAKALCRRNRTNTDSVVIIGSGASGHSCAETLRQEGFTGNVVLVTKEKYLPYDRTKVTKAMSLSAAKLALRSEEYYQKGDINIMRSVSVDGVDVEAKSVLLSNGNTLSFTHLVIATGGRPRPLPCPGTHLSQVYLLRTPDEANAVAEAADQRHVVIVGTSFISMEAAAFLVDRAASVTVVGRSSAPFSNVFGAFIGKRLQAMHEEKGVRFVLDAEVSELRGDEDGRLTEVELTSGQTLAADLVVSGLGVVPCTDFLRDSDVRLDRRGYVPVDQFMRTNCKDVYATGDIASFPMGGGGGDGLDSALVNVGHWQMALHHGRTAALAILGRPTAIDRTAVPFFWSSMFGKSVRFCGWPAHSVDDVVVHGDVDQLHFAAFYCAPDGRVSAVATMNFDPLAIQFAALLREGGVLTKQDVVDDAKSWLSKLS